MQPASGPELGALLGLLQVTLGQPGRTNNDLTHRFAIVWHIVAFTIDDAQIDHGYWHTGLDPQG
ncbi:hypothetical protein D3C76_1671340 [compost metagenome]